jgi:hypothetical protein
MHPPPRGWDASFQGAIGADVDLFTRAPESQRRGSAYSNLCLRHKLSNSSGPD